MIFVDTSALYAFLDADDANNVAAVGAFDGMRDQQLLTHNYVVVEATALVKRRLGGAATRALTNELLPVMSTWWIDAGVHQSATAAFLSTLQRRTSLVDMVSFEVMRRARIRTAFAFDRDFVAHGFETVP